MQRKKSKTLKVFVASVAGAFALIWSAAAFAGTPTLGPDCGVGAALVGTSSDSAGKVTLGAGASTCTLTFGAPYANAPACSASNETNNGGSSQPIGAKSTPSSVTLGGLYLPVDGDVISYICVEY